MSVRLTVRVAPVTREICKRIVAVELSTKTVPVSLCPSGGFSGV